ncbi:MAG TPA: carbon storage regulator [Phycisphaerales bacterium]|nr:carbon storage regulator [Phycisphaerales bacterium]HCD31637.1 carbon storage regulator [Phycisphaerales bacterium]|tara:strand:- start:607 stop:795 length:189 start_codon:yes stop_codon:yes gene_type:complete
MLVLARKVGQDIIIGDDIIVRITAIKDGKALVGVQAPENIRVDRSEIRDARLVSPKLEGGTA